MTDCTHTLDSIIDEPKKVSSDNDQDVFILGAGFSKAIAASMSTMDELGVEVRKRLSNDPNIKSAIPDSIGDNIESWITFLSLPQPWQSESEAHLNRSIAGKVRQTIVNVIEENTISGSECRVPEWLNRLIFTWHQRKAVVVTMNYDTLIEKAAISLDIPGVELPLHPSVIYPRYFTSLRSRSGSAIWGYGDLQTFRLLKLHGSVNWHYSGRDSFYGETVFYSDVSGFEPTGIQSTKDADDRELREMAFDKEVLLIPPVTVKSTYFENESIRAVWKDAAIALKNATSLYIVGYSLPESDLGMRFFLADSSLPTNTPIYLVDINPDIIQHYKSLLVNNKICSKYVQQNNPIIEFARIYADVHLG